MPSRVTTTAITVLALLALLVLMVGPVLAETPLEKVERLSAYLEKTDSWALRCMCLLALSDVARPEAVAPIAEIVEDRDMRLRAYAVEALAAMPANVLRSGASADLVDRLVSREFKVRNAYYHGKVGAILAKIAERGAFESPRDADSWWREIKRDYRPAEWVEPPAAEPKPEGEGEAEGEEGGTQVMRLLEKLYDIGENGLEITLVIDATGSMQMTIDGVRDAVDNLAAVLESIVPRRFRLGLVIYRDLDDMSDGARIAVPLTRNTGEVKEALAKEQASGGGDVPERVEKGLELALSEKNEMRWGPETGKVVIIIGDAPPHDDQVDRCVELAKNAHERPFGVPRVAVTGGGRRRVVPFIVSTLIVGRYPRTAETFQKIAEAGGGTAANLANSNAILTRILTVSFGEEWEAEISRFVDIFVNLREAGIFR